MNRRELLQLTALMSTGLAPAWARGNTLSSRPVSVVVAFTPGGGTDAMARAMAGPLAKQLSTSVVVENRPGAGTAVAAVHVAKAKADGHTLLVTSAPHTNNPALIPNLPFDPVKDFAPISLLAKSPFILVVRNDSPIKSLADMVALAKTKKLSYATSGNGTNDHISTEMLSSIYDISMIHSPYKGTGQALIDLLGGHVDMMMCNIVGAASALNDGRLRGLAVTTEKRASLYPQLPTVQELTGKPFDVSAWTGILAPADTPPQIVGQLHRAIVESLKDPKVQETMSTAGAQIIGSSPEEFRAFIAQEIAKTKQIVKDKGITV